MCDNKDYCKSFKANCFKDQTGQWIFNPPVYEQRYMTVVCILRDERWRKQIKKLVDFGCADMALLSLLRNVDGLEHIMEVDIDENILCENQARAKPLVTDWVKQREHLLRIEVLKGSITTPDERLRGTDAVLGVEILEHLHAHELEKVPQNVFGFIQPKLVIFTTPNKEVNVLFDKLLPNGFRHIDHKFEWTRKEFAEWTSDVCKCYTNYSVSILGAGMLSEEHKHLGFVTQIAVFVRHDVLHKPLTQLIEQMLPANTDADLIYKEIFAVDFPYQKDERSRMQKITEEIEYQVRRLLPLPNYYDEENDIVSIPIEEIASFTAQYNCDAKELKQVLLELNYTLKDEMLLKQREECMYDVDSQSEEEYFELEPKPECMSFKFEKEDPKSAGDSAKADENWD